VDFRDTPEELEYRRRLQDWLAIHIPPGWQNATTSGELAAVNRSWHGALYAGGYIGQSWPTEWGGKGLSPVYDAILNDEAGIAGAPPLPALVNFLGRAISLYANEAQKSRYLPGVLSGEVQWCQGFSEPDAGSDLAALRTRAVLDGDRWVVNGQKMWTSGGLDADWCFLLARTDPSAPKHRGISVLLFDMRSPGISVRPIVLANGDPETSEIFFENVSVPIDQMLGQPGDGWGIAMTTVSYERGPADIGILAAYRRSLDEVTRAAVARGLTSDQELRRKLAKAYVRGEVLRLNSIQQLSLRVSGRQPGAEGSVAKLLWTETEQELAHLALDILGPDAVTGNDDGWLGRYLRTRPLSVYGGSSQIQRNLLAWRVLGMPRAPSA
jgi:alkylation response protein AidB-like acyl-CoA dehydrogenase